MSYRIDSRNLALLTYPKKSYGFEPEGIRQAVSDVHEAILSEDRTKHLVVFIHGRGKFPEKAFGDDYAVGEDILHRIESEYPAKVLMVHWPSWLTPWGYPSKNAIESGAHLMPIFAELRRYRQEHPQRTAAIKTTLLVHSMGARVLESFLTSYDGGLAADPPIFDSIVLNAPDVDLVGHRRWLDRVDFAGAVYVTVNPGNDELLKFSEYLTGRPRLGRSLMREDGAAEPLSDCAVYVDVSATGVNHDYFIGTERRENLVWFYRNVIGRTGTNPLEGEGVVNRNHRSAYTILP